MTQTTQASTHRWTGNESADTAREGNEKQQTSPALQAAYHHHLEIGASGVDQRSYDVHIATTTRGVKGQVVAALSLTASRQRTAAVTPPRLQNAVSPIAVTSPARSRSHRPSHAGQTELLQDFPWMPLRTGAARGPCEHTRRQATRASDDVTRCVVAHDVSVTAAAGSRVRSEPSHPNSP